MVIKTSVVQGHIETIPMMQDAIEQSALLGNMTVHVLGHPDYPLSVSSYPANAQVLNCHNFCLLLGKAGLDYVYYGLAGSELPARGTCKAILDHSDTAWDYGNTRHAECTCAWSAALREEVRKHPGRHHLVISLFGAAQADVETDDLPVIEAMVGYDHCWAPYRVFPSYAQQHAIYTSQPETTEKTKWFDTVIPHFLDPSQYEISQTPEDYVLYLGRNAPDKGINLAEVACEEAGIRLIKVHDGIWGKEKSELISRARTVMMPTVYIEPFGYVAIEAQMCGTPVITTDWGAFAETVVHGKTGFRCRTQAEFVQALGLVTQLDRHHIRQRAVDLYSIDAVLPKYLSYFRFVWKVHHEGGYYAKSALRWCPE